MSSERRTAKQKSLNRPPERGPERDPERDPERESDKAELRTALVTYPPAIVLAFALNWTLVNMRGWEQRRSLVVSALVGIAIAVVLQRAIAKGRST